MKFSKKILSIVLSALMVFSMMPITAFAATALTKVDNNLGTTNFNTILYNGIDYIAINYEGVNADKKIVVKDCIADAFLQNILLYPQDYDVVCAMNLNGDYISEALLLQQLSQFQIIIKISMLTKTLCLMM